MHFPFPSGRNLSFDNISPDQEKLFRMHLAGLEQRVIYYAGPKKFSVGLNWEENYASLCPLGGPITALSFDIPPSRMPAPVNPGYIDVRLGGLTYTIYRHDISGGG